MDLARCERCAQEYDLELVPDDGLCVLPECEGEIVYVRVIPYAAYAGVALGAAAVLGAFAAMADYNELVQLGDWRVCSALAAALGALALWLGRGEGPWAFRARVLGFLGLVCAYPPFVIMSMLLVGFMAFVVLHGGVHRPPIAKDLQKYRDGL